MKRSIYLLFVILVALILSGCIISKTPNTNDVAMRLDEQKTFSVSVFPSNATYSWMLDGEALSNTGKAYVYTAEAGEHDLTVKATHMFGTDIWIWHITCNPITDLLNSMVSIPAGSFMMGSTDDEYGMAQHTTPVHQVSLQAFDIGAYEVTQSQYLAVMGTNPSYFQGPSYPYSENRPVEMVYWTEAREFCTKLSLLTGRTFDLPSESQWEYACRAGTTTLYSFGDLDADLINYAWYTVNSGNMTHSVGTQAPNAWGLYDMHGNVWEWILDSWHTNYVGAPTDGSAWEPIGSNYMFRGGAWNCDVSQLRSAHHHYHPVDRRDSIGFRVVMLP